MSAVSIRTGEVAPVQKCRSTRHKVESLIYADLGPGNGGFLINVNKGGMAFQGILPVEAGSEISIRFKLPGTEEQMETPGRVVWVNDLGKGGGFRFSNLPEETRRRINRWLSQIEPPITEKNIDGSLKSGDDLRSSPRLLSPAPKLEALPAIGATANPLPTPAIAPSPKAAEQPAPIATAPIRTARPAYRPGSVLSLAESKWDWVMPAMVGLIVAALIIGLCFAIPAILAGQIDQYERDLKASESGVDFGAPKPPKYSVSSTSSSSEPATDVPSADHVALNTESPNGPSVITAQVR